MTLEDIAEASTAQAEAFIRESIEMDRAFAAGIYDEWLADQKEKLRHEFSRREAARVVAKKVFEVVGTDPSGARGDDAGED